MSEMLAGQGTAGARFPGRVREGRNDACDAATPSGAGFFRTGGPQE